MFFLYPDLHTKSCKSLKSVLISWFHFNNPVYLFFRDSSHVSDGSKREFHINLSSCSVGSYVLVVWNSAHNHYVIMQVRLSSIFFYCRILIESLIESPTGLCHSLLPALLKLRGAKVAAAGHRLGACGDQLCGQGGAQGVLCGAQGREPVQGAQGDKLLPGQGAAQVTGQGDKEQRLVEGI